MDIVEIYPDHLFSIKNEGEKLNEYQNIFKRLSDKDAVLEFFKTNECYLKNDFWGKYGLTPENAAASVIEDVYELEQYIEDLCKHSRCGTYPDLDDYFRYLDGQYAYELEFIPMKGYGSCSPTFVRIYALKIQPNVYVIVYGGLKLAKKIKDSPVLKDDVMWRIDTARRFLKGIGVSDGDDLK